MTVWLVRAGAHGEYEQKFLRESRVYVTWEELDVDLSQITDRKQFLDEMAKRYPDAKARAIAVAEITGDCHFESKGRVTVGGCVRR